MKPFAIPLAGLLAARALIVAELNPLLRIAEASIVLQLSNTAWGGADRPWYAAALMVAATLLWALDGRRWPAFLSGIALGLLADICISGWEWRADQMRRLAAIGLTD